MSDETCKTCRYWLTHENGATYGECSLIRQFGMGEIPIPTDALIGSEVESFSAKLITGDEFGCAMHDPRKPVEVRGY